MADRILKRIDKLMEQMSEDDGLIEHYELIPKFLDLHNPFIIKVYINILFNVTFTTFKIETEDYNAEEYSAIFNSLAGLILLLIFQYFF